MKSGIIIFCLFLLPEVLFSQQIALTFDDAPRKDGAHYTGMQRTEILIEKLKEKGVIAAFYCVAKDMNELESTRLKMY